MAFVIVIVLIIIGGGLYSMGYRNRFVELSTNVDARWADVEVAYQRRYELIPNLANTVKGYLTFEQETLTTITEARSRVGQAVTTEEKLEATTQLESAFSRLLVVMEDYPELKGIEAVENLMVQLEGTQNRIDTERLDYNEAVETYNEAIGKFPGFIFAGMFGYTQRSYFTATLGAEIAPTVDITP